MSEGISAPFSFIDSPFVLDPIRYTEGHLDDIGVYIYKTLSSLIILSSSTQALLHSHPFDFQRDGLLFTLSLDSLGFSQELHLPN